jgi:hypothetical protein
LQAKELSGLQIRSELGHHSSDDEGQEERANVESAIRVKTEAVDAWREECDDGNNDSPEMQPGRANIEGLVTRKMVLEGLRSLLNCAFKIVR